MTLPSSNNNPPISLADLNTEFGRGFNLNAYRSTRWFKEDNSRGFFSAGTIDLDDFYGTRVNSPVVAGSATLTRAAWNGKNYPFPMFNNLSVTAYSGSGGTSGNTGNCEAPGAGGTGGVSSFGTHAVTSTGAAGPYGGSGSVATATASWAISDANQASILALYGQGVAITAGAAGTAGGAGKNQGTTTTCNQYNEATQCISLAYVYYCGDSTGAGSAGVPGYISLSWT